MNCKNYKCYRKNLENYNLNNSDQILNALKITLELNQSKFDKKEPSSILYSLNSAKNVDSLDAKIFAIIYDHIEKNNITLDDLKK